MGSGTYNWMIQAAIRLPLGRYRWPGIPFGLSPALGEVQRRTDITLEGIPGQKVIADDILVFGSEDT